MEIHRYSLYPLRYNTHSLCIHFMKQVLKDFFFACCIFYFEEGKRHKRQVTPVVLMNPFRVGIMAVLYDMK